MLRSLTLCCFLVGCAASPAPEVLDDPVVDAPDEPVHPCDEAARVQFDRGQPWTPDQKDACFDGCDRGDEQGFQQGRLACLSDDDPCPECVATQPDPAYDVGYNACYVAGYTDGYQSEGCDPIYATRVMPRARTEAVE